MSDKTEKPDGAGGWVPSAEHPVPPTTEFSAIPAESVQPTGGPTGPDEVEADPAADAGPGSPSQSADDAGATSVAASADAPAAEAPAWKTPPAAGLPPQWGDPDAQAAAQETGPQPDNGVANLWGLAPEDRPEVALGAALAAGVLTAIVFRTLARR